jgi:hypothetical protein
MIGTRASADARRRQHQQQLQQQQAQQSQYPAKSGLPEKQQQTKHNVISENSRGNIGASEQ